MIIYKASEIIKEALNISQCVNSDITFKTMIQLLDVCHRKLLTEVTSRGAGSFHIETTRLERYLLQDDRLQTVAPYLYSLPSKCWRITRVFIRSPNGGEVDLMEVPESYGTPDSHHYRLGDRGIYTSASENLYISYEMVPVTATTRMKAIEIDCDPGINKCMYDSKSNQVHVIKNGLIDDTMIPAEQLFGGHGKLFYMDSEGIIKDIEGNFKSSVTTPYWDWRTGNWSMSPTMTLNDGILRYSNGFIMLNDQNITTWILGDSIPLRVAMSWPYMYIQYQNNNDTEIIQLNVQTFKVDQIENIQSEDLLFADVDDTNGYGLITEIQGTKYLTGAFPDTVFNFDKSIFFDVLITRLALDIMAYLGQTPGSQAILLANYETEFFKQSKRSHAPLRIKNVRRIKYGY